MNHTNNPLGGLLRENEAFHGTVPNQSSIQKFDRLRENVVEFAKSANIGINIVPPRAESQTAYCQLEFPPATHIMSTQLKSRLAESALLCDDLTLCKTDTGLLLTFTILNIWEE